MVRKREGRREREGKRRNRQRRTHHKSGCRTLGSNYREYKYSGTLQYRSHKNRNNFLCCSNTR
jgi:hypothetical protein